ncbi:isochorismatase family protein [Nocardia terpenica]|uniref:Isochorismatase family protein n=1 Tax=Nocardia terpenica TaxID=455432 RepID=A0A6G9Z6W8_9NOCA|nr:isochorismatase family protein [Nocardia terpenica]
MVQRVSSCLRAAEGCAVGRGCGAEGAGEVFAEALYHKIVDALSDTDSHPGDLVNSPTPKRALLVIDVQNEYITGNLRIEYPPVQDTLTQIGRAMDTATTAGIPIVLVQHTAPQGAPIFDRDTPGWHLPNTVTSRPHNLTLEKTTPSVFTENNLEPWLSTREINTHTVVGYMTRHCNNTLITHGPHQLRHRTPHRRHRNGVIEQRSRSRPRRRHPPGPQCRHALPIRCGHHHRSVDRPRPPPRTRTDREPARLLRRSPY